MKQSLYADFVRSFFPQLVTEIVEQINNKRQTSLPYLYKDLLVPEFTMDSRWSSITAKYNRVAADVVSLDSELPLKSRDTISTAQGDIPKMGMKLYLSEKQMKEIDSMIAQSMPIQQIVNKIFDDVTRCIEGIYDRIEDIFQSELSTGIGLSTMNNGTGVRIDMQFDDANRFGVSTSWDEIDNATALDDLTAVFDKADADGNTITDMWADDMWLRAFYKNKQVREQYAFNVGFVGQHTPVLDFDKAAQVIATKWGVTLHRVNRKIRTELNGKKADHFAWKQGVCAFTCNAKLGALVWTNVAEVAHPAENVDYQTADDYILVSKYHEVDPLREFTSSQAMVLPVLNNVDQIYLLDSKEVTA